MKIINLKSVLTALVTMVLVATMSNVSAYTDYGSRYGGPYGSQQNQNDPADTIKEAIEELKIFTAEQDNVHPAQLREFLEVKIFPRFDFDAMSRWITGPYARRMTPEDKIEFQNALKETFLSSLVKHLGGFDPGNTTLRFHRTYYRGNDEAVVKVNVYRNNQRPDHLDFGMRLNDDGEWQVVDVRANGTSAVVYYRTHFINKLREYGRG
jgi:phospholipid transport system substrate-binding protein